MRPERVVLPAPSIREELSLWSRSSVPARPSPTTRPSARRRRDGGTDDLKPNSLALGGHVADAGDVVAEHCRILVTDPWEACRWPGTAPPMPEEGQASKRRVPSATRQSGSAPWQPQNGPDLNKIRCGTSTDVAPWTTPSRMSLKKNVSRRSDVRHRHTEASHANSLQP